MRRVLAASAILHVGLFALVLRARAPEPPSPAPHVDPPAESTIEIEGEIAPAPLPTQAATEAIASSDSYGGGAAARGEPGPAASATPDAPSARPAEPAPVAENGAWIVSGLALGMSSGGQVNPFLGRGALPTGTAETNGAATVATADPLYIPEGKRAEQAVKDALRARDHALGLGPEGPVIAALEDAAHAGFAPERGLATFVAVVDERGIVVDLKLTSSSASDKSGARGWEDVRARAVKTLASAKIEMRGIKRAELTIAVESSVRMPSGTKVAEDGRARAVTPTAKPTAMKVETNAPPSPGGAGVVAGATVAEFDVADIGAKATRVVHAKLVLMRSL